MSKDSLFSLSKLSLDDSLSDCEASDNKGKSIATIFVANVNLDMH